MLVTRINGQKTAVCYRRIDEDGKVWDEDAQEWAAAPTFAHSLVTASKGTNTNAYDITLPAASKKGLITFEIFYAAAASVDADTVPDGNPTYRYNRNGSISSQ